MNTVTEKRSLIYKIAAVGLMSALVYLGNYMSIPLSNNTRIHLGNSMCLLAGLLFGGVSGGLSSGIGGALYDLFSPIYFTSAPYTFFSKFAMGWVAGKLSRSGIKNEFTRTLTAAIYGQITYIILYLGKSFVSQLILGNPVQTASVVMLEKAATSFTNGIIAVAVSVPLCIALRKALRSSGFASMIEEHTETRAYFKPMIIILTVLTAVLCVMLLLKIVIPSFMLAK